MLTDLYNVPPNEYIVSYMYIIALYKIRIWLHHGKFIFLWYIEFILYPECNEVECVNYAEEE